MWLFRNKQFESKDIKDYVAFTYLITTDDGLKYIGVKSFHSMRKPRKGGRRVKRESNWQNYYSSSEVLKEMVKDRGKERFTREIISLHKTVGDARYWEVKLQFQFNVLEDSTYLNETIGGKWHRKPQWIIDGRLIA